MTMACTSSLRCGREGSRVGIRRSSRARSGRLLLLTSAHPSPPTMRGPSSTPRAAVEPPPAWRHTECRTCCPPHMLWLVDQARSGRSHRSGWCPAARGRGQDPALTCACTCEVAAVYITRKMSGSRRAHPVRRSEVLVATNRRDNREHFEVQYTTEHEVVRTLPYQSMKRPTTRSIRYKSTV